MSDHALDIKDFKIDRIISDYGTLKCFLVEELKTKRKKILYQINYLKNVFPMSNASLKLILENALENMHPLFSLLYGYCFNNFQGEPALMIFFHDSQYGTITNILESEHRGKFIPYYTSTKKYIILLGISLALKYDHSRGNINRYLSTKNIYIDDNFYPRIITNIPFMPEKLIEIDSIYKAPEILNGQEYTYASDVYSFSIILYEIITGQTPVIKDGELKDLTLIKSEIIRNLISKCSSKNQNERPTFCEISEILMKDEFKNYFNVNEEEVLKFLELIEDDLKDPNLLKQKSKNDDDGISLNKEDLFQCFDQENLHELNLKGINYFFGNGVEIDQEKGLHYMQLAADKGCVEAMVNLGNIYLLGENISHDINKSIQYLKMAADKGSSIGMYYYGFTLLFHLNDKTKGIQYIKLAADNGCYQAMNTYATLILTNPEFKDKKKEAAKYLKKSMNYGSYESMGNYGRMLFDGDGIKKNQKKGLYYIKKAADFGNVMAMLSYILCFLHSKDNEDSKRLFTNDDVNKYIQMLVKTGNPTFIHLYSEMLGNGDGMPVDLEKSLHYLKLAADKGCLDAIYQYGLRCRDGFANKINKVEAAYYLKMAADKGNDEAMQNYAVMLYEGDGIPQNSDEALKYMKMAADAGNANAIALLANK